MDKIKNIISVFLKTQPELINENTIIDKTAIQGSILIHRMYAEIEKIGYKIDNYNKIHTLGDIIKKINGETGQKPQKHNSEIPELILPKIKGNATKIGIDIEEVSNFNMVEDFREDTFYKQNFSDKEISYCLLQPNILQSFTGKFAAKEAIIKADNYYKEFNFNKIEILNLGSGKPFFNDFELSISHTNHLAIAVAIQNIGNYDTVNNKNENTIKQNPKNYKISIIIAILAFIISISSLVLSIT